MLIWGISLLIAEYFVVIATNQSRFLPETNERAKMQRSTSWRRVCPESVSRKIEEALTARYYILHQTGPSGFVLREEQGSKKVKVFLGDPNVCSCAEFKKNNELCQHILWIILKRFRVPRANPLVWQLGLVEREMDEIILGYVSKQSADQSKCSSQSHDHTKVVSRRIIEPEDMCPICQDNIADSTQPIVFCRFGCGQNIHTKCMKIMADHQRSQTGGGPVQCPLCRVEFGSIHSEPSKSTKRLRTERASLHLGVTCSHCYVCPVAGRCFRCSVCASYHLCEACYSSNQVHLLHSFQSRKYSSQPWRSVSRPPPPSSTNNPLSDTLVSTLQSRSLTENDYELLLQLDSPSVSRSSPSRVGVANHTSPPRVGVTNHTSPPRAGVANHTSPPRGGVSERVINALHVEPLDGDHPLIVGGANCEICGQEYNRGEWIRKLPCQHKFHRGCVQEWLLTHSVCPLDGRSVNPRPTRTRRRRLSRPTRDQAVAGTNTILPLTRALMDAASPSIRGQRSSKVKAKETGITISGHRINRNWHSLRSETKRGHSGEETTLPHTSAVARQQLQKRVIQTSSFLIEEPPPPHEVQLAPTVTSCCTTTRSGPTTPVRQVMSHDLTRGGNKDRVRCPPRLHHEEYRSVSLPSLGGGERGAGSVGGRRIVRGSLAAHRGYSNTSLTTHASSSSSKVEVSSLQVGSFKLYPLPSTHSNMLTTAAAPYY